MTVALVILSMILINAIYVAAEFATVGVRRTRIRQLADDGNPIAKQLDAILSDPKLLDRYIAACQIGITISSLVLGAYGQANLSGVLRPMFQDLGSMQEATAQAASAATILVLLTIFQMVFGELVPKSVALQHTTKTAMFLVLPMRWSMVALSWFINILNGSGNAILRLFKVAPSGHHHVHSPDEIGLMITESRMGGMIKQSDDKRLKRALQLSELPVNQLMVPRPLIEGISIETPMSEAVERFADSPFTRLPVFRTDLDDIVGIVHTKDVMRRGRSGNPAVSLSSLVRPIVRIPESATAYDLLTLFRQNRTHHAVVLDEFGGTEGLVTLDDVLSALFGRLDDEFKRAQIVAEKLPNGWTRLSGWMHLHEVEEWIGVPWEGETSTVGGLVREALGSQPIQGTKLELQGCEVEVERVVGNRIDSLLVRPLEIEEEED